MNKEEFLKEEIRCDFKVSEKRKKIWYSQLEMLKEIDRVCKKYDLKYFAANGTLLGAVRHNGFVPWDDDVDISMPRKDYEKFMEVAPKEIGTPYILETGYEGKNFFRKQARLRDASTTGRTMADWDSSCVHGIFVDIFPMDGSYTSTFRYKMHFLNFTMNDIFMAIYLYYKRENKFNIKKEIFYIPSLIYVKLTGFEKLKQKIKKIQMKLDYEKSEYLQMMTHGTRCIRLNKKYFANAVEMDFEYTKIPVPAEYDELLKQHYGDYMQLPPVEERGLHHSIFFDPDRSYKEYEGKLTKEEAKDQLNNY